MEQLCSTLGLPASDTGQDDRPGVKASEKRLNCKMQVQFQKEMGNRDNFLACAGVATRAFAAPSAVGFRQGSACPAGGAGCLTAGASADIVGCAHCQFPVASPESESSPELLSHGSGFPLRWT